MNHETFIRETYQLAKEAVSEGNHPFGALLVHDGNVVLRAKNSVTTQRDVTRHAELNLASKASARFEADFLEQCTLYTSTEPCIMCCGAIFWANVRQIVYGVEAATLANLTRENYVIPSETVFAQMQPTVTVIGPILEEEGLKIHSAFW